LSIGQPNSFRRPIDSGARNENERIRLIVNPRAGAGRAGGGLDALKRAADRAFANWDLTVTEAPGHASALAKEATEQNFDIVAAVGGDGTCNEVVNGLIQNGRARRRKTVFTVIPMGTGGDLSRTLRIPRRLGDALWIASTGITLPTDIGLSTLTGPDGDIQRAFINVAGFGANGAVVAAANQRTKRLGGRLTFLLATLDVLANYQPTQVQVTLETENGQKEWSGPLISGFVANGAYCGGGMWVGKKGTMQDGYFDITLIPAASRARQLRNARRLFDGNIHKASGIIQYKATKITIERLDQHPLPIDLDGETPGVGPATFEIAPRAIQVRGGWLPQITIPKT
jgi:diacylglycerol kinase (ATP)